jgi:hypothetical protein
MAGFRELDEEIRGTGGATLGEFWRWAYSDLLLNVNRAVLAEYLVGRALGAVGTPCKGWEAVDFEVEGVKVEVKAAGYRQSWGGADSKISFDVGKKKKWVTGDNLWTDERRRWADVYVFCLHAERDHEKAQRMGLEQWEFYVLDSPRLNAEKHDAKRISLGEVRRIACRTAYEELEEAVMRCGRRS